jgi:hypothetical protein
MLSSLNELVRDAASLADEKAYFQGGRRWEMEGGRSCPHQCGSCSQPVFIDRVTGEYDYGEREGPAWDWCATHCKRGFRDQFVPLKKPVANINQCSAAAREEWSR